MAQLEFYHMAPLLAQAVEDGLLSEREAEAIATETVVNGLRVTVGN